MYVYPEKIIKSAKRSTQCYVFNDADNELLEFQFVPNDINFVYNSSWSVPEIPGRKTSVAQFIAGGRRTVSFSIDLYAMRLRDNAHEFIKEFMKLTEGKEFTLVLGENYSFRCVIADPVNFMNIRYRDNVIAQAQIKVTCLILEDINFMPDLV